VQGRTGKERRETKDRHEKHRVRTGRPRSIKKKKKTHQSQPSLNGKKKGLGSDPKGQKKR